MNLEVAHLVLFKLVYGAHQLAALQGVRQAQRVAREQLVDAQQQRAVHQVLLKHTCAT